LSDDVHNQSVSDTPISWAQGVVHTGQEGLCSALLNGRDRPSASLACNLAHLPPGWNFLIQKKMVFIVE
jgi:hypothetical protein